MKYPFDTSEQLIYDFEEVLNTNKLAIENNSDLERISISVFETNSKNKKEIQHDNSLDIRAIFADVAGIVEFVSKIVKHKDHPDFSKLIPHLHILNKASSAVLTSKSKITDDGNNKLMELYFALLCMDFAEKIDIDDPNNSKGDNPDIMFTYQDKRWAIACKAMHSDNEKTLYDTIEKGTDQINKSQAEKGIVIVNFKNIIDRNKIWPIINEAEVTQNKKEPLFACFPNTDGPVSILRNYGCDYQRKLIEKVGAENLVRLKGEKCPAAFVIFLQALTSIQHNGLCPPTILKTLNLVLFDSIDDGYKSLVTKLNEAMHDRVGG